MSKRSDMYKVFLKNETLIKEMDNCLHSNNGKLNPFHLEDSVLKHTLMVFANADHHNTTEMIMALCHDIGKVLTRNVKEDSGKVTFYGHADASIQPSIDFADALVKEGVISVNERNDFIIHGLPAMANHMLYYQNSHKINRISNGNDKTKKYVLKMAQMDSMGSICKNDKVKKKLNIEETEFKLPIVDSSLPIVYIWCGLPCSGKDYIAERFNNTHNNNVPIVSFDDIRIEHYKRQHNVDDMSEYDIYANAFEYCNNEKIDLNKTLRKHVKRHIENGKDVSICNTSLTCRSRRSIINTIGPNKCNFIVNQVFVPTDIIGKRNSARKSKFIPTSVITRMMNHMTVATHFEKNINKINYIYNK